MIIFGIINILLFNNLSIIFISFSFYIYKFIKNQIYHLIIINKYYINDSLKIYSL